MAGRNMGMKKGPALVVAVGVGRKPKAGSRVGKPKMAPGTNAGQRAGKPRIKKPMLPPLGGGMMGGGMGI